MDRAYEIWRRFQERCLAPVAALLLLGPTLLAIVEVVRRYAFGASFPWRQDAVTYGILAGVFLFFGITQSRGLHLRVTLLPGLVRSRGGRVGERAANLVEVLVAVLGMMFCVYLVWHGIPVAERMVETNRMTESQVLPLWPFFAAFLAGMALMAVSFAFQIYVHVQALRGRALEAADGDRQDGGPSIL